MESSATQSNEPPALPRHNVDGNELALLPGGEERLEALIALIESARERLDICYYIFTHDVCGDRVLEALIDACNRDVAVTLLVDAFGSANTPQSFFDPLIEAGARFGWFGAHRSTRYLIRNHQKMVIADGKSALIGGFNCDRSYFGAASEPLAWCDLGLMVKGPWAVSLERWFDALAHWTIDTKQHFRRLRQLVRAWQPGEGPGVWLVGGPTRQLNNWARKVKSDLETGGRLDLVAAYFSPSPGMIRRINRIARREGASLITPSKSDNTATIGAARHLYRRLLRAGVQIFEYRPQKLHMKLIVIDDVTYVGSANFDMRSLFLNLELMLRIEDAGFASEARALIDTLEADSRRIDGRLYDWMAGPVARVRWWLQYLLVGVLDYTVTRRLNFRRRR
ncbi:MAG: phosphatidylserine/phosphatidylglycerophosphate/cardiolipin synthase family protein [Sphingomonas sp.]|nr:phosphatidylserine/phosphatidylglycerophosphate/cardiolipin synthase family protein [Sphingomonas sp.]